MDNLLSFRIDHVEYSLTVGEVRSEPVGNWRCPLCDLEFPLDRTLRRRELALDETKASIREHHSQFHHPLDLTASAFASWVYAYTRSGQLPDLLYERPCFGLDDDEPDERQLGVAAHADIERYRLFASSELHRGDWRLLYSDPHNETSEQTYLASALLIRGEPIRCRPDVVLRHDSSGAVLVIERKTTSVPCHLIPVEGYQKDAAQLWCYAWIDDWRCAPDVILVCEYWHRDRTSRLPTRCDRLTVHRRHDQWLHCFCSKMFSLYGGEFAPAPIQLGSDR